MWYPDPAAGYLFAERLYLCLLLAAGFVLPTQAAKQEITV